MEAFAARQDRAVPIPSLMQALTISHDRPVFLEFDLRGHRVLGTCDNTHLPYGLDNTRTISSAREWTPNFSKRIEA